MNRLRRWLLCPYVRDVRLGWSVTLVTCSRNRHFGKHHKMGELVEFLGEKVPPDADKVAAEVSQ